MKGDIKMIYTKSKEVKEIVTPIYVENWESEKMQKYCINKASVAAVLSNEKVFVIEKPSIETNFCFGYGMYLQTTDEEQDRAEGMAEVARTKAEYFISENMKSFNRWIDSLNKYVEDVKKQGYSVSTPIMYFNTYGNKNSKLISITRLKYDEIELYKRTLDYEELSADDARILIEAYEQAKALFEKRLQNYLKKYGLTRLNVWTYLVD